MATADLTQLESRKRAVRRNSLARANKHWSATAITNGHVAQTVGAPILCCYRCGRPIPTGQQVETDVAPSGQAFAELVLMHERCVTAQRTDSHGYGTDQRADSRASSLVSHPPVAAEQPAPW